MIPLFLTEQTERQGSPFLAVFARMGISDRTKQNFPRCPALAVQIPVGAGFLKPRVQPCRRAVVEERRFSAA